MVTGTIRRCRREPVHYTLLIQRGWRSVHVLPRPAKQIRLISFCLRKDGTANGSSDSFRRTGFTLVELLVVIGLSGSWSVFCCESRRPRNRRTDQLRIEPAADRRRDADVRQPEPRPVAANVLEGDAGLLNTTQGGKDNGPAANPFDAANPEGPVGAKQCRRIGLPAAARRASDTGGISLPKQSDGRANGAGDGAGLFELPSPMRAVQLVQLHCGVPNQTALNAGWKWTLATLTPEYAIAADINPGKGGISFASGVDDQDVTSVAYDDPPKVMVRANSNNHKNQGQQVAFADGHVEWSTSPFCGPTKPGRAWRNNIYCNTNGVDEPTGKGGTVHAPPMEQTDVVLHPGDGRTESGRGVVWPARLRAARMRRTARKACRLHRCLRCSMRAALSQPCRR